MALNSKRMQTFFNEFLMTTTDFLNKFVDDCERKFIEFETKLYRIESNLVIIEAQVS
jgi:Subunit CCDC53 of WASH complex